MTPMYPNDGSARLLQRGMPVAPIAPPGSFQFPPSQTMPGMQSLSPGTMPKPMPDVPQINPGMPKPMGDIPQINPGMPPAVSPANPMMPKPQTGAPQINPGPTGNLTPGRGALVNAIMNRTQAPRPQMGNYRPPQGMRAFGQTPKPNFRIRNRPPGV